MSDRTVHASYPGMEIVRYDRAGKWYFEPLDSSLPRQKVTVREAAHQAVWATEHFESAGRIFWDRKGGSRFDRLVLDGFIRRISVR